MTVGTSLKTFEKEKQNAGFFVPQTNSSAWEIQDVCKNYSPSELLQPDKTKVAKNRIFPRLPQFEYSGLESQEETEDKICFSKPMSHVNVIEEQRKYSPHTSLGFPLECQPNFRSKSLNPYSYPPIGPWQPQPQFWYQPEAAFKGPTWPVGNPNDYNFQSLPFPPPAPGAILEAMEIERPERYIPGEIYKNKTPKDPVENLQGTGGCKMVWEPKNPKLFYSKFDPLTLPKQPLLSDAIKEEDLLLQKFIIPPDNLHQNYNEFQRQPQSLQKNEIINKEPMVKPNHESIKSDIIAKQNEKTIKGPDTRFANMADKINTTNENGILKNNGNTKIQPKIKNGNECKCCVSRNNHNW